MYQGRIASSPVCCNPGRFLDKRRFTRINLRKQHAFRYPTSGGSRGAAGGGPPSPLFLDQTEAWKAEKKIWGNRLPSSSNLSKGLDDRPPPPPSPPLPYLKVWIQHCPLLISQRRLRNELRNSPYWWRVTNLISRGNQKWLCEIKWVIFLGYYTGIGKLPTTVNNTLQ